MRFADDSAFAFFSFVAYRDRSQEQVLTVADLQVPERTHTDHQLHERANPKHGELALEVSIVEDDNRGNWGEKFVWRIE